MKTFTVLLYLVVIGLIVVYPMAVMWSMGVLFDYHIPLTWSTWIATSIIMLIVYGSTSKSK